jgi:UDP-GlcNAc:undecaprenyl-phosphate/decaprenyl-phosphate GlcNAc-1-phosphate transferase
MLNEFLGPKRPLDWFIQFWPVLIASLACAVAATWLCKSIALRLNIVDKPDNLVKTHKKPVAYLGGIGVLVGFSVGILCGVYLIRTRNVLPIGMRRLFGILAGATIACFVGLLDDLLDISPTKKMLGQIIAAVPIMLAGILPDLSEIVKPIGWQMSDATEIALGIPIVVFFVIGASNSLNLLDGLD